MDEMVNFNGIDNIYHVLKFLGWAFNPNWSRARKKAQICFGAFAYFSVLVLLGSELSALPRMVRDKNYELVFAGINLMQAEISGLLLAMLLIVHAKKIQQIDTELKETIKFAFKYSPEDSATLFPQSWHHSNKCLGLYVAYFGSLMLGWFSAPVSDFVDSYPNIDYQNTRLVFTNADYGLDKSKYYWHITALHMVSAVILITPIAFGGGLPPFTCILIQGQVTILLRSFERASALPLTKRSQEKAGVKRSFSLRKSVTKKRKDILFEDTGRLEYIDLRDCIKHHQIILRLLKKTEKLMGHFTFINVSCCVLSLINSAVAITTARTSHTVVLYSITVVMLLVQVFFLIWHLTMLQEICYEVAFAAFSADRGHGTPRRLLSLIINRSNREETFSCVLTNSLTFAGLFKILRLSWNYFTLCRQKISREP